MVVGISGDLLLGRAEGRSPTMRGQDLPAPLPQCRIILGSLQRLIEDLGKDGHHLCFKLPMLVLEFA